MTEPRDSMLLGFGTLKSDVKSPRHPVEVIQQEVENFLKAIKFQLFLIYSASYFLLNSFFMVFSSRNSNTVQRSSCWLQFTDLMCL